MDKKKIQILLAYEELELFIGQGSLDIDTLLSGSTKIIELNTALQDAGLHLESAHSHFKQLNHPFYSLILPLLGYEKEVEENSSSLKDEKLLKKKAESDLSNVREELNDLKISHEALEKVGNYVTLLCKY